jgi:molybdopterin biosynthesis enzyme
MAGQDSHHLRAMADANSLTVLPDGAGAEGGGMVDVILTDPERLVTEPQPEGVRQW